jgi:hypothetical protein
MPPPTPEWSPADRRQPADDMAPAVPTDAIGRRLIALNAFLITDIDHTLIGEDNSQLDALVASEGQPRLHRFRRGHRPQHRIGPRRSSTNTIPNPGS